MEHLRADTRVNSSDSPPASKLAAGLYIVATPIGQSTFGAIEEAVHAVDEEGLKVAHIHIDYLNPMPKNMASLLSGYKNILVPEMNSGQLVKLLRSAYLVPAEGLNKVTGQPFKVKEISSAIRAKLGNKK